MIAPTTNAKRMPPTNSPSLLLSNEENKILFRILGDKCQAQATAVVQVFGTDHPNHNLWNKRHCGVATLTKDSNRKSYFMQIFDIEKEQRVFEQELYNQFSYHVSLPFFHQFESDNQMIGLNFADDQEAEKFKNVVLDRLATKQRKREERRRKQQQELEQSSNTTQVTQNATHNHHNHNHQHHPAQTSLSTSNQSLNKVKKGKNKRSNRIRKGDIGEPRNFQHITHVGFDQNKGFSTFHDENLLKFFENAGVNEKLLQDDKTRKFIYDFIERNGGLERATRESKMYEAITLRTTSTDKLFSSANSRPALPSRSLGSIGSAPPPPPPRPHPTPPPPPPPKDRSIHDRPPAPAPPSMAPPPPSIQTPPPPPPPTAPPAPIRTYNVPGGGPSTPPPAPPPPAVKPISLNLNSGPCAPAGPPPPPPPPPPPAPVAPSPSVMPPKALQDPNPRNELLAQIRQRPNLQPVTQKKLEKPPPQDSRTTLMSEIRNKEYELKHVEVSEGVSAAPTSSMENTMAALLARALDERARVIGESDSDDEDDEEDDEWDDN